MTKRSNAQDDDGAEKSAPGGRAQQFKRKVLASAKKLPVARLPVIAGRSYELTIDDEKWLKEEISRTTGLDALLELLGEDEKTLIEKGFGAAIGYSHLLEALSLLGKTTALDDWLKDELLWFLNRAQTGFKLSMLVAETSLGDRNTALIHTLTSAKKAAEARWSAGPKALTMNKIHAEFQRWQAGEVSYKSGAAFARAMCLRYPAIENERSIQNKIAEWKAEIPPE